MTTYDASPYLAGNFAPVSEEVTAFDLTVTGTIPDELQGRFLRNGPNPRAVPDMEKHHWFFGEGMVHGGFASVAVRHSGIAIVMWLSLIHI